MSDRKLMQQGIDIYVMRGPSFEEIATALRASCGLSRADIAGPDDGDAKRLDIVGRPLYATVFVLTGGDVEFKVDLDGTTLRDYEVLARSFGNALATGVIVAEERTPDSISSILLRPDSPDVRGYMEDAPPDGVFFRVSDAVV
jgi:hypothetical protein